MYILGINLSHDRSACLIKDGNIVVAIAEERLDRNKKSIGHLVGPNYRLPPFLAINYCLRSQGLGLDDLDLIVADNPVEPVNTNHLKRIIPIRDKSKIVSIPHPSHHLAHAYSAYFCSSFEESAVLVADSYGSEVLGRGNEGETGFYALKEKIKPVFNTYQVLNPKHIHKHKRHYSLTYIYRFISLALGFNTLYGSYPLEGQPDEAGKTMGLSTYGKHREEWGSFLSFENNIPNTDLFYKWVLKNNIGRIQNGMLVPIPLRNSSGHITQIHKDLAYKAQEELEKGLIFLANQLYKKTRSKNLCIAGGAGLNCLTNRKIQDNTPFKNIFIQPAATDDGIAIGCAFYGWHKIYKRRKRYISFSPYLGRHYSDTDIISVLGRHHISIKPHMPERLIQTTARYITQGKIIGWFQGKSEFGPRALGNRSILADPRNPEMKALLNAKVKQRESFRPYSPSVLAEHASDYFDLKSLSPFMLLVGYVKKEKFSVIPAVTHVDGSARVQTVTKKENNLFYSLIKEFYCITGIPLILNTSFNTRGQPIIETPQEALDVFFNTHMDILVLGNCLLSKEDKQVQKALETKHDLVQALDVYVKNSSGY